jgi:hypothetical protein
LVASKKAGRSTTPQKGSVYLSDGIWLDPIGICPPDAYDPTNDPVGHRADAAALHRSGIPCEDREEGTLLGETFLLVRDTRTWTAPGTNWKGVYGYGSIEDLIRIAVAFGKRGTGHIPYRAVVDGGGGERPAVIRRHDGSTSVVSSDDGGSTSRSFVPDYSRLRRYAGGDAVLAALGLRSVDELVEALNRRRPEHGRLPVQQGNYPTNKRTFSKLAAEYASYLSSGGAGA